MFSNDVGYMVAVLIKAIHLRQWVLYVKCQDTYAFLGLPRNVIDKIVPVVTTAFN